jgi:hypothetical protein
MRLSAPFACLLLLTPVSLSGQELLSARGFVRDRAGAPIQGAELLFGNRMVTTNAQGAYLIDSLPPGQVFVAIRFPGYVPIRTSIRVEESRPNEFSFVMSQAPFELPPIVTEFRRKGIYGAVGDTLQHPLAGVRVQVAGVNGGVQFTDSLGGFAFPGADRGAYVVRITSPGYGERRFSVELNPGEGRQIVAVLAPSRESASRADDRAFESLGKRLAFGLRRERLMPSELDRYGSLGLCDVPSLLAHVGRFGATTTLILNGVTLYTAFPIASLCAWRADDVSLVEFGSDICADVTQTAGEAFPMPVWCSGRTRNVPRSAGGAGGRISTQRGGTSYIIIWEKR